MDITPIRLGLAHLGKDLLAVAVAVPEMENPVAVEVAQMALGKDQQPQIAMVAMVVPANNQILTGIITITLAAVAAGLI